MHHAMHQQCAIWQTKHQRMALISGSSSPLRLIHIHASRNESPAELAR
jgi:hypothetical protein